MRGNAFIILVTLLCTFSTLHTSDDCVCSTNIFIVVLWQVPAFKIRFLHRMPPVSYVVAVHFHFWREIKWVLSLPIEETRAANPTGRLKSLVPPALELAVWRPTCPTNVDEKRIRKICVNLLRHSFFSTRAHRCPVDQNWMMVRGPCCCILSFSPCDGNQQTETIITYFGIKFLVPVVCVV